MVSTFDTPQKKKPHELTDLNGASKVNYSYRSSGDTKPSGNSLLESYLVTNNRAALSGYAWSSRVSDGWWDSAFSSPANSSPQASIGGKSRTADIFLLNDAPGFGSEMPIASQTLIQKKRTSCKFKSASLGLMQLEHSPSLKTPKHLPKR